jgi:hypothetical protein
LVQWHAKNKCFSDRSLNLARRRTADQDFHFSPERPDSWRSAHHLPAAFCSCKRISLFFSLSVPANKLSSLVVLCRSNSLYVESSTNRRDKNGDTVDIIASVPPLPGPRSTKLIDSTVGLCTLDICALDGISLFKGPSKPPLSERAPSLHCFRHSVAHLVSISKHACFLVLTPKVTLD